LAELTGIGLRIDSKESSNKANYLDLESGLITINNKSARSYKLTSNQRQYLRTALQSRSSKLFNIPFSTGELKDLIAHLDRYFKFHIEGLKDRKSDAIFEQILQE
jgi:hypothetical protein